MRSVKRQNTSPEIAFRKILHSMGYRYRLNVKRYRLNVKTLSGTPDICLPKYKTAIFIHGCFWHRHQRCKKTTTPKSNEAFWLAKFKATLRGMSVQKKELEALGWKVLIFWECETIVSETIREKINEQILKY